MRLFEGVALFCTGLTLDTYVTGALNPVRRARLRAEEGKDGNRNSPKRREIPYRRRSSDHHEGVEDDRLSARALRRTGRDTGWSFFPGSGTGGQSVSARCFRRHRLITSAGCVAGVRNACDIGADQPAMEAIRPVMSVLAVSRWAVSGLAVSQ
jgi:hypothetical protein